MGHVSVILVRQGTMKINIAELIKNEFKHIAVNEVCEGFAVDEDYLVQSPLNIQGEVWYESGITKINLTAEFKVTALCARCAGEFDSKKDMLIEDEFTTEDLTDTYGAELDTTVLVKEQITLDMPLKMLCSPDCKGLCAQCGTNLNLKDCGCAKHEYINPQFASLSKWQMPGKAKD